MKFKHRDLIGNTVELISTRTVTFFNSPEFGHMVVDGKMADGSVVDRGKLIMRLELTNRPGHWAAGSMLFNEKDFRLTPDVFISRAEILIHDTVIANYTKRYQTSDGFGGHYVYDAKIPQEFQHVTEILKTQVVQMVKVLEQ